MLNNNQRYLIVNADDFGLSEGVNQGIIESFEKGIVTSASLMARHPASREAASYARTHPKLSLGLHVDLGEWAYREGEWVHQYPVIETDQPQAVADELMYQLGLFRDLVGKDPTHLDSHQHMHRDEPVRSILIELARGLDIPLRECTGSIRYEGRFYGQSSRGEACHQCLSVDNLTKLVYCLPLGITELGCHPGLDRKLNSAYRLERVLEVSTLCSEEIRSAMQDARVKLISFGDVGARRSKRRRSARRRRAEA